MTFVVDYPHNAASFALPPSPAPSPSSTPSPAPTPSSRADAHSYTCTGAISFTVKE